MRTRLLRDSQIAARLALRDIPRHFYDNTEAPMSFCCRFRLLDLMDIGTVVFTEDTRVHRFYDGRKVEFIKKHDAVFANYRSQVIERLRVAGLPDTEAMFIAAEKAHVGYHLHSIESQELHQVPVSRKNFTEVQALLYYLDDSHNKTRWQFQLLEPHVITSDAISNLKHWRKEYNK